jgi:ubiquinone/menaquinone biosynthesis C-methylase UbiE
MTSRSDEVQRLFDAKAPTWSAKYEVQGALAARRSRFVEAVSAFRHPPADVLDYGCGSGNIARALAEIGYSVSACDISKGMIRMARATDARSTVPITWIDLDAKAPRLPFEDRSFDAVIASSVFEYLADPLTALRQLRRIMRNDGCLLFTVPNPAHRIRRLEAILALGATRPIEQLAGSVSGRLSTYVSYLRLSHNRLDVAGWDRLARAAGFGGVARGEVGGSRDALLMLRTTPL